MCINMKDNVESDNVRRGSVTRGVFFIVVNDLLQKS
jgi:hypothetical protein